MKMEHYFRIPEHHTTTTFNPPKIRIKRLFNFVIRSENKFSLIRVLESRFETESHRSL